MKRLSNKTALLTGASRGIGVHIARRLADQGMNLALAARSAAGLEAVAAELEERGARTIVVPTDVGDPQALEALVEKTEAELGGIALLVNNAGLEQGMSYVDVSTSQIDQIIDVNLRGPMLLTHRVLPGMIARGEGHICQIASVAGLIGTAYNETYSATKHGLVGFARGLRLTAQSEGWPVEISVVCPGFVSEAGMYADIKAASGVEAPAMLGTVPAEKVADEVLRAIVENDPEVIVNATPLRPMVMASSLMPRLGDWLAQKSGAVDVFKKSARKPDREA